MMATMTNEQNEEKLEQMLTEEELDAVAGGGHGKRTFQPEYENIDGEQEY